MEYIKEIQKIELRILIDIDKFCKKHKIIYYLGEGTLLGAIRHNGFIPWDDDVDILMPREDYEKFLKIAPNELKEKYEIQHFKTIKKYWSPFIKVRDLKNNKYYQKHIDHLTNNNGPLVDIFPLDYVPKKTSFFQKLQSIKIRFLRRTLSLKLGLANKKRKRNKLIKFIGNFIPVNLIHFLLDKTFKFYNKKDCNYIANLGSYYHVTKQTFSKEYYGKGRYVKFEGHDLPIPKESEKILTSIYGNYMELPPIEKQRIKHHFDVR